MPRTKSRNSHSASSRKSRSGRSNASRQAAVRGEDAMKIRRYLDFLRAITSSPSRNGR